MTTLLTVNTLLREQWHPAELAGDPGVSRVKTLLREQWDPAPGRAHVLIVICVRTDIFCGKLLEIC
jgi:hypothetical protein